ncbi:MAG TPA: aminotransferase DegT [Gammaproteobacteria bacterium]|nr:aminotransferase DegT [Gammaproteobacteria bacterium]
MRFIDLETQQDRIRTDLEEGIHRVLHHGRYVLGDEIDQLEAQLAEMSGAPHCICVSSGTDALLAALMAIELKPGDEVITSPFTFFSTAETIALLGGVPIYVDIDPETFNLDPGRIDAAISPRTRAIMPVSLYGQCAEMDEINAIARHHTLRVIEDAAQSFGASFHGRRSCALSDLACTSFFPAKPLGAYGDGGACFTQDASLANRLRQIRDHGQEGRYHHTTLGINGRLDTIQAAVLIAKLKIFPDETVARQRVADRYAELLADLAETGCITLPVVRSYNTSSWAQYTIRVADREGIQQRLAEQGIPSAVHYPAPLYDQPALLQSGQDCPESDRAAREVLSLPMHPYLDDATQLKIVQSLQEALASSAGIQPEAAAQEA